MTSDSLLVNIPVKGVRSVWKYAEIGRNLFQKHFCTVESVYIKSSSQPSPPRLPTFVNRNLFTPLLSVSGWEEIMSIIWDFSLKPRALDAPHLPVLFPRGDCTNFFRILILGSVILNYESRSEYRRPINYGSGSYPDIIVATDKVPWYVDKKVVHHLIL